MSTGPKAVEEPEDMISELPLSLREYILEHIPIKQAVRTSLLSTKWKHCWNGMTSLVFDESIQTLSEPEFIKIIDASVTCHRGCITKFVLHIPFDIEVSNAKVDAWLLILSRKSIREIVIECFGEDGDRFTLPSHFFNCCTLTRLALEGAVLRPPSEFSGFPNLETLELKGGLMCSQVLESVISKCPQLKRLSLAFATASDHRLPLVLDAPNLVTLNLHESVPGNIILKNVPTLTSVTMMSSECMALEFSVSYSPLRLLESLSGVIELAFDFQFLEVSHFKPQAFETTCPKSLHKKLTRLASLTLEWIDLWKPEDLRYLFCILRSSPNLQTLTLRVYEEDETMKNDSLQYLCKQVKDESVLSNVWRIRFEGCKGFKHEIVVLKIILARCPHLDMLQIEFAKVVDLAAAKLMFRAVMHLPRLSNGVKFVYSRLD